MIGIYLFLRLHAVPETWRFAQIALAPSEALGTRLALSRALEHLGRNQEAVEALRRALPLLDVNKKQQIENLIRQYD